MNVHPNPAGVGILSLVMLAAGAVGAPVHATAVDLSITFGAVTAEPLEVERIVQLTGPGVKPTRAAIAVVLITVDGTLPADELASARKAMNTLADYLKWSAKQKYGDDVPISHEIVVTTEDEAGAHRERLKQAGFTFIDRADVPGLSRRVVREGFGLKEFAPADVMGEGAIVFAVEARPTISKKGSIRLNLTTKALVARVTSSVPGADRAALDDALERQKTESLQEANTMLRGSNLRAWVLTPRDREAIVAGVAALKKAVPLSIFGRDERLKLTIPAELVFAGAVAADPSWDFSL